MSKKNIITGLMIIIVFQLIVLSSEYLGAIYPLWTGKEIKIKTIPVDPRSLFRGNYARLQYDISTIDATYFDGKKDLRNDEVVYVKLKPAEDGLFVFEDAGLEKPEKGPFLRGRLQRNRSRNKSSIYNVRYGIEAYFAPKEKALALEKDLRRGGVAIIMIAENGKATLKDIVTNEKN